MIIYRVYVNYIEYGDSCYSSRLHGTYSNRKAAEEVAQKISNGDYYWSNGSKIKISETLEDADMKCVETNILEYEIRDKAEEKPMF